MSKVICMAALAAAAGAAWAQSPPYRSAFEGYQRFADEQVAPWRESNDTVARRGGWRAYAREAGQPQPAPAPATPPAVAPRPVPPAAPAAHQH